MDDSIMTKPIIARKHLEPCEMKDCELARPLYEGGPTVCCFGLRNEGCIHINPDLEHRVTMFANVETQFTIAMYEQNPYLGAGLSELRTRVIFPSLDNIIEPVMENVGE